MTDAKTLVTLVKASNVKRFHTVPVIGEQTVGHHTHRLIMVLRFILGGHVPGQLLWHAMFHDLAESVTGDVPATMKWVYPGLDDMFSQHENQWLLDNGVHHPITSDEKKVLNIADKLESVIFATEQMKMGNENMRNIRQRAMTYVLEQLEGASALVKDRVGLIVKECLNECQ